MKVGILDDPYNTFIKLADISLNIYVVEDQIEQNVKWLTKNFSRITRKIKRPEELTQIVAVLKFDTDYFDDKPQLKSIPISSIRKNSRLILMTAEDAKPDILDFTSLREERIVNLFQALNQRKLIEDIIVEIQNLNTETELMNYYLRNSNWISFKDLFDLYYTFKIIK